LIRVFGVLLVDEVLGVHTEFADSGH